MPRLSLILIAAAVIASMPLALAQTRAPIPSNQDAAGVTQIEWSQRWWQWAFSFERARSPVADLTGQYCASRQTGDVWYLAGTYGTRRTERTCAVPSGKYLFFPLINYVAFLAESSDETCQSLVARVAKLTDAPSALVLAVDGIQFKNLQSHRLASPGCFSLIPGGRADAASNGYYIALPPLDRGKHIIEFGGVLPDMVQAVTYTLDVE